VEVGGRQVERPGDLQSLMVGAEIGHPLALKVWRGDAVKQLEVVPDELQ